MEIKARRLAILFAFAIDTLHAQSTIHQLQQLVETSARRLVIAEQVALAKWDNGAAVEDARREAEVVMGAVKIGQSRGLDRASASKFFQAQIEANKVVQYSLLADWRRAGRAPVHRPINLVKTIRPQLDRIETELIVELADTAAIRAGITCRADVAKAAGKYALAHNFKPLYAIALDRALASACTP